MGMKRDWTKAGILHDAAEKNVAFFRLQFNDMLGAVKAVELPVSMLEQAMAGTIPFDGSSVKGFSTINHADMQLLPDLSTWTVLSYEEPTYGKVARLICTAQKDGVPFEGDSRYLLERQVKKAKAMGFGGMAIGFEPEFYLFKLDANGKPIIGLSDRGGYFDVEPADELGDVRRDIAKTLGEMGFAITAIHHEVGGGQNEIDFLYDDAIHACDNVQTFKQAVRVVAKRHGYLASFMPKPIAYKAGNGMHDNVSLFDPEGNDVFFDPNGSEQLSNVCFRWLTGLVTHAKGLAALTNPTVNSYKRLVPGYEAPCYACWSFANRSAMIRIPDQRGKATRTEIRNVDPTANPYLANAAILAAGLEGIKTAKNEDLVKPAVGNVFAMSKDELKANGIEPLPENLKAALEELEKDPLLIDVLGAHAKTLFIKEKEKEWDDYKVQVSPWEIDRYLNA